MPLAFQTITSRMLIATMESKQRHLIFFEEVVNDKLQK